jgi:hypothetical protein
MNHTQLKEHFDVKKCPNKEHFFEIGNMLGSWQIADDDWSAVSEHSQTMRTEIISFVSVKHVDGTKFYSFTIFKLKIVWGFAQ